MRSKQNRLFKIKTLDNFKQSNMKYLDALRFSLEITDIRKYLSTDYIPRRGVIPQKIKTK